GELKAYTEMLAEARAIATQRMIGQAQSLGADAIVDVRYSSSAIMQGAAEILVAGTAVKFMEE
ncbi:MAG: heavy metal-binding domain-containing protein, partial [Bacillota bacterium]